MMQQMKMPVTLLANAWVSIIAIQLPVSNPMSAEKKAFAIEATAAMRSQLLVQCALMKILSPTTINALWTEPVKASFYA
jgi:hypothetical protein